jgi:hypothetical protein
MRLASPLEEAVMIVFIAGFMFMLRSVGAIYPLSQRLSIFVTLLKTSRFALGLQTKVDSQGFGD